MKKLAFLLLIVSLFVSCPVYQVQAEVDGNMLLNNCAEALKYLENKNDTSIDIAALNFCVGYISGINDLHTSFVSSFSSFDPPKYCLPQQINSEQLVKIVFKFLKAHPEDLNLLGSNLVLATLQETFPCP